MSKDPRLLLLGIDVNKGLGIHETIKDGRRLRQIETEGGYWGQTKGLHEMFGKFPYRVTNTAIDERAVLAHAMGMTMCPTTKEGLENGYKAVADLQYIDYAIESFPTWHILASLSYTSKGTVTSRTIVIASEGAVAGGGPMHSHNGEGAINQFPSSVYRLSVASPEILYKGMRWLIECSNNPAFVLIDRSIFFKSERFTMGTGYFEPGRARIVRDSKNARLQIVTYGPMTSIVEKAIDDREDIGVLDVAWQNPFPEDYLREFIATGSGPVLIIDQEPKSQGFGNQIQARFRQDDELEKITMGRKVKHIASEDVPAPPCDGILLNEVIPTELKVRSIIAKYLPQTV